MCPKGGRASAQKERPVARRLFFYLKNGIIINMNNLDDIVSLCKRRGFIFPGSDVYGGMAGTWDFGPLGVTLKNNIVNTWWSYWVDQRDDMFGIDAAILALGLLPATPLLLLIH